MIDNQKIKTLLDSKKIIPGQSSYYNYHQEQIDRINLQRKSLSNENNNLALYLINLSAEVNAIQDYNQREDSRIKKIKESVVFKSKTPWETDAFAILKALFGEEAAPYAAKAWHLKEKGLYQSGYLRRSFRAPNNSDLYFLTKIDWLYRLWQQWLYDMSLVEYAQYSNYLAADLSYIFAAAIDSNHPTLYKELIAILQNESEVGKVSRSIIKALLLCSKPEAWEAVKNLLLAAQRQEGLRQTILECLDETNLDAMKYMIKVVLDENLLRFSSVVRALDVWTGMNWESQRASAIKQSLSFGLHYLENPDQIPQALESKNNIELYMALWAQGCIDVEQCYPLLKKLVSEANQEKRNVAYYFAKQTDLHKENNDLALLIPDSENHWDIYWKTIFLNDLDFNTAFPIFKKWHQLAPKKPISLPNKGFEWIRVDFSQAIIEQQWIYLANNKDANYAQLLPFVGSFSINARETFIRDILTDFNPYSGIDYTQKTLSPFQRKVAFEFISDRSSFVQNSCMNALKCAHLTEQELPEILPLLKRKNDSLRQSLVEILVKNFKEDQIFQLASELILDKEKNVRVAAIDLILHLANHSSLADKAKKLAKEYIVSGKASADERLVLDQLDNQELSDYTKANGFGWCNPGELPEPTLPEIDNEHYFAQRMGFAKEEKGSLFDKVIKIAKGEKTQKKGGHSGFSKPYNQVIEQMHKLNDLIAQNKDYEYQAEDYYNPKIKETLLIGNSIRYMYNQRDCYQKELTKDLFLNNFPLAQLWLDWFESSGLDGFDLFYLTRYAYLLHIDWVKPFAEKYYIYTDFNYYSNTFSFGDKIAVVLKELFRIYRPKKLSSYCLEACIHIANEYVNVYKEKPIKDQYSREYIIPEITFYAIFKEIISHHDLNDVELRKLYQLERWENAYYEKNGKHKPNHFIERVGTFYNKLSLNESQKSELILQAEILSSITNFRKVKPEMDWRLKFPELANDTLILKVIDRLLEVEFARGEAETEATPLVFRLQRIFGLEYLFKSLLALGKEKLNTGYYSYYGNASTKKEMMSHLLKIGFPKDADTQDQFNQKAKELKLSESRLVEVAMYAPQWRGFVQNYLGWEALDSAIWWLHAHSSTYLSAEKETEIARFSSIAIEDFNRGAVDVDWFNTIYPKLGKAKWKMLYDAAKYIEYGNGHTLAKLYSDVILTNVKITEVTKRVKEKRNQNYLRVYGLVPLSKTVPEKDVLNRYNYLQQFLKESKQFGSQKQASEKQAVEVALDNLARNAGYPDPIRLTWAMEGFHAEKLLESAEVLQFNEVNIALVVDENGKAHIDVEKNGKALKNIPAKLAKDKKVLKLKEFQKQLKEQYSRTRKALEQAMVNQDAFAVDEIQRLFNHPIVRPMIGKLVLRTTQKQGLWVAGKLIAVDQSECTPKADEPLYIAHCTHLHASGNWSLWQKYCFEQGLQQPFKQIFRELYLPTKEELKEQIYSNRYAGHQVQPKKTVALLKGRGWTVDYDYGLQKVLHKENILVGLRAMADWFSPSDVESPTLESIVFSHRKDFKNIALGEIPPYIFSEIMRDVDLVVSVTHTGGVDPEASLSTVELRKVIAEESARLFKLKNVSFKDRHILVQGKMASYNIHLGSGVVHKQPGGYLNILPVHSQHRGRIFLPFMDEDPRTAEIVSKMLLLAEDHKIQDPTVLQLIQS